MSVLRQYLKKHLSSQTRNRLRMAWFKLQEDWWFTVRGKIRRYINNNSIQTPALQLGCGTKPFRNWLNVDQVPFNPEVVGYDLRKGLKPFPSNAFNYVYHEHFFEHLERREGQRILQECFRVLKPGGTIRIAMPDLDRAIRGYLAGWSDEENEILTERKELYGDQLLGTPGEALDTILRGWSHKFVYGEKDIRKMLELNGFVNIQRKPYRVSEIDFLNDLETRPESESSLAVEAEKPS